MAGGVRRWRFKPRDAAGAERTGPAGTNLRRITFFVKIACPATAPRHTVRPLRRHVSVFALVLAWLFANGAVWNIVQVVAWAKMFQDYAQVMPVDEALRVTFEGEACQLCHVAQSGADAAREQLPQSDSFGGGDRLLLAFQAAPVVVVTAPDFAWPGLVHEAGLTRTDAVPVPPPRA